ncbi:hypothetical protein H4R26_000006 [Coemansia thaxteri]|uniref:Transcription factor IIIC putative zinc-finger domain-containing protein n=1 Tax=Coemansia thaxteri TaxID=2663907 RepID=A0A9W8BJ31_9FUNG|nr:hypothetical protein H4R26_000006 [Coemansia thaxteri]
MAGDAPEKREVSAAIEPTSNIEEVCLLERLPEAFAYAYAMAILASDSSVRIFAPLGNPDIVNWSQVGSYKPDGGGGQMCTIGAGLAKDVAGHGGAVALVACGYMDGTVDVVGVYPGAEDRRLVEAQRLLRLRASNTVINHVAWLNGGNSQRLLLLICAVDGRAGFWKISTDLSQADLIVSMGEMDWRPFTAHASSSECVVDQINWDVKVAGDGITRVHYHQLSDWTAESTEHCLYRLVNGHYRGELRYVLWDLVNECTPASIATLVECLQQMNVANGSDQHSQRLTMLNFIACTLKGAQLDDLATEARSASLDLHVQRLLVYLDGIIRSGELTLSDADRAYLTQVNWTVHQPAYAGIVSRLPRIMDLDKQRLRPLGCPVCSKEMALISRLTACCSRNHIFDICSVTLAILGSPGSDQCNTCMAKHKSAGSQEAGIGSLATARFSQSPVTVGVLFTDGPIFLCGECPWTGDELEDFVAHRKKHDPDAMY